MGTTREVAQFVVDASYQTFPAESIEVTKALLLKTITGMVVGAREPVGRILTTYLAGVGGSPESGIVSGRFRSTVENAALAHGTFAHASELEDDQFPGIVGTYWVFPAIFALAEKLFSSGRDIITAAAVSWEVTARLGLAGGQEMHSRHILVPAWYGVIGAAAAAAKLLKLDTNATVNALSIAASHSSGLRIQMGTGAHFLEAGHACRAGVLSALMAKEGVTGNQGFLETPGGYMSVAGIDRKAIDKIAEGLGKSPFQVHNVWIKKYPCCFMNHPGIDALKMLMKQHDIRYEDVEVVQAEVNKVVGDLLDRPAKTLEDSRFSFYHVLGEVLLRGTVDLSSFTWDEKLSDPKLAEAKSKIKIIVHPEWPPGPLPTTNITLVKKDGQKFTKKLEQPIGGPQFPLSTAQVGDIFAQLTEGMLEKSYRERVAAMVLSLEEQADILPLMNILTFQARA